jgi:hypothetical protein
VRRFAPSPCGFDFNCADLRGDVGNGAKGGWANLTGNPVPGPPIFSDRFEDQSAVDQDVHRFARFVCRLVQQRPELIQALFRCLF